MKKEYGQAYIGEWNQIDQNGDVSTTGGILIDRNNDLMFKLRLLNSSSTYAGEEINAYDSEISHLDFEDDRQLTKEERKNNFADWAKGHLFIFQIWEEESYTRYDKSYGPNYVAKNLAAVQKNDDFSSNLSYELIPIIGEKSDLPNREKFENSLNTGRAIPIDNTDLLGKNTDDISSFAIFHEEAGLNYSGELGYLYENLDLSDIAPEYLRYVTPAKNSNVNVRKIKTSEWMKFIYFNIPGYDDVSFVPTTQLMVTQLDLNTNYDSVLSGDNNDKSSSDVSDMQDKDIESNLIKDDIHEIHLISNFRKMVKSKKYNLTLNDNDLVSFYLSLKTSTLTVLAGLSGTGKSKIITAFADALGVLGTNQFKMISVRPSWQDDSDLLGYADTMHNVYRPSDSGLVEMLVDAAADPNHMYIVVLDEMNLARIEHYFSQFISVLERNNSEREIRLYNSNIVHLFNSDRYPSTIKIGSNIRFVGTVNIDESTFSFSDKLMDRANIIELQMVPFNKRNNPAEVIDDGLPKDGKKEFEEYQAFLATSMNTIATNKEKNGLTKNELDFFWKLDELFLNDIPDGGFGWRTLNSVEGFLASISEKMDFNRQDALDYQVAQRILPKLRGTSDTFNGLLEMNDSKLEGKLLDLLDEESSLSDFVLSRAVLLKKAKELQVTGFVS